MLRGHVDVGVVEAPAVAVMQAIVKTVECFGLGEVEGPVRRQIVGVVRAVLGPPQAYCGNIVGISIVIVGEIRARIEDVAIFDGVQYFRHRHADADGIVHPLRPPVTQKERRQRKRAESN